MLAAYLVWHLRQAWAPLTFTDENRPEAVDPVAPAQRSKDADAKAATKTTTDDQPAPNLACVHASMDSVPPDGNGDGHYMRFKGPKALYLSAVQVKDAGTKRFHAVLATKSMRPNASNLFVVHRLTDE